MRGRGGRDTGWGRRERIRTRRRSRGFGWEAVQAVAAVIGFVALGVLTAALSAPAPPPPYPLDMTASDMTGAEEIRLWLLDGFNVLQVGVLQGRDRSGWWREERRAEVVALAERFRRPPGSEILVVFDGERAPVAAGRRGGVGVVFAPSADEWVLARVRRELEPERIAVVTADRRLADRARRRGATVVAPGHFLACCEPP